MTSGFTALTGVARLRAKGAVTIVHAVIHHAFFFCLNQQHRKRVVCGVGKDLFSCQNAFSDPVVRRPAHAQPGFIGVKNARCDDNVRGYGSIR